MDNSFFPFNSPIINAFFKKRLNRFVSEFCLPDGTKVQAHSPNTGSMKGLLVENSPVLLWDTKNEKRKYQLSWIAIKIDNVWVGIDTLIPNRFTKFLVSSNLIKGLFYPDIKSEVTIKKGTRLDLVGEDDSGKCFIEVKNVTLVENGVAQFPDAVSKRGSRHLNELIELKKKGHRCAMVYIIQREDAALFEPAKDIDPVYAKNLAYAQNSGVEIFPVLTKVTINGLSLVEIIPYNLELK